MLAGEKIVQRLRRHYPPIKTALEHRNPFELLIATILSAQSTDVQVNRITPRLFEEFPSPRSMAEARVADLEEIVRPTGFYHVKARTIKKASEMIEKEFGGRVPRTMAELLTLPGVGRKTANIVLSVGYSRVEGIAVDTHVRRVSKRIGLTDSEDPKTIEQDLMRKTPRNLWPKLSILLILHGRKVCRARSPLCGACVVSSLCSYYRERSTSAGKSRPSPRAVAF